MGFRTILFGTLIFATFSALKAQFVEDALRFVTPNAIITPRVAGLGISYNGLADDIGALYYNPAGLVNIARTEVSFGLGFTRNNSEIKFLDNTREFSSNNGHISNFGVVYPIRDSKKNAAIGIGYFLESDYDSDMEYSGFNTKSTYIADEASIGNGPDGNYENWAELLFLANREFKTPLQNSLTQTAFIRESGGMHNIIGGAAFNLNDNISVGFSITGKFGSYEYSRSYEELDNLNIYDTYDEPDTNGYGGYSNLDFHKLNVDENINQNISGITGAIGIQGRIGNFMRFGITVKLPTFYEINEKFSQEFVATYDNAIDGVNQYSELFDGKTSYDVTTPFIYSAGFSFQKSGFVFAAGAEYADVTQLEFSDAFFEVRDLNKQIARELAGQVTWGFGFEYEIPRLPLVVRGSYSETSSPYSDDIDNSELTNLAFGCGVYFGQEIRIDALVRLSDVSVQRTNYGSPDYPETYSYYHLTTSPMSIALGLTYRY